MGGPLVHGLYLDNRRLFRRLDSAGVLTLAAGELESSVPAGTADSSPWLGLDSLRTGSTLFLETLDTRGVFTGVSRRGVLMVGGVNGEGVNGQKV